MVTRATSFRPTASPATSGPQPQRVDGGEREPAAAPAAPKQAAPASPAAAPTTSSPAPSQATRQEAAARAQGNPGAQQRQTQLAAHTTGQNGEGRGLNRDGGSVRSASGRIPAAAWDHPGPEIVGRLTQNPAGTSGAGSASGPSRCGPSNLLAGALMRGPGPAADLLHGVSTNRDSNLTQAQRTQLNSISEHVRARTATFEELGQAQDLMYRAGNRHEPLYMAVADARTAGLSRLSAAERTEFGNLEARMNSDAGLLPDQAARLGTLLSTATGHPATVELLPDHQHPNDPSRAEYFARVAPGSTSSRDGGFEDGEMAQLARMGGVSSGRTTAMDVTASNPDGSSATMARLVASLRPGESAAVRVSGTADGTDASHFITVGRQPDGTPYVYNPDPDRGDHTLFVGHGADAGVQPRNFMEQLQRYDDRIRTDRDGDNPSVTLTGP